MEIFDTVQIPVCTHTITLTSQRDTHAQRIAWLICAYYGDNKALRCSEKNPFCIL